jgi:hypothetical protein
MPQALFGHATLGAVLRYWEKKRGKRRMPARRDIDPIEMDRRVLPQLMLCEVSAHGNLVRFRLVGTSLARRFGFDPTGQCLGDFAQSQYFDFLGGLMRRSYAEAAPIYAESAFHWGAKGKLDAQHLLLPLSASGSEAGILLIATAYGSDDVFPPPIRVLDSIAEHRIGLCHVLTPGTAIAEAALEKRANIA